MKKALAFLTSLLLLGSTAAALPSQGVFQSDISGSGEFDIDQSGTGDVAFLNKIQNSKGRIDFTQDIQSGNWKLDNNVNLHGKNLRISGPWTYEGENRYTFAAAQGTTGGNNGVSFSQQVHMGESSHNWDAGESSQKFTKDEGTDDWMRQKVRVNPTANNGNEAEPDRMDISQAGDAGVFAGTGYGTFDASDYNFGEMAQSGKVRGDYNLVEQQGDVNGDSGYSGFEEYNSDDWADFDYFAGY